MSLLAVLAVAALSVPGRASATPSIAADGAFVVVVWGASLPDGTTDVFAAVSRDGAKTFGGPVQVNDVAGDARLNGEQPPHAALSPRAGRDPLVTVVWTAKESAGTALRQARSEDGGRTFAHAATIAGSEAAGNRGWENVAADSNGRVYLIWLDHRELAESAAVDASHHQHGGSTEARRDGVAMAQKSKAYVGALDGSVPAHAIAAGVCYCCKTALAIDGDGAIYAAWRHVYPGNMRDIAFSTSRDGGRTFTAPLRASEDNWMLDGCPENGPAIAVDPNRRVHLVWPTLVKNGAGGDGETLALFYASSRDGRSFTARRALQTDGVPRHPQLAIAADGAPVVVWDEAVNGTRRVVEARISAEGREVAGTRTVLGASEPAVYPSVAVSDRTTVVAWTSGRAASSVIHVARVP